MTAQKESRNKERAAPFASEVPFVKNDIATT
ncbi:Hypothetical protein Bdt_2684 [Bdellovibrio bacteriovorus str. Tiberius]|uniref:Uncharacterized protein n=1 Tax=Bdellovibrio bacteriovorus str. Tiberius TaxID=1069642 RepID=K7YR69_BDEBC|nr:Hypothetical protein Bdt_2684 [Bdellovibrio bacteriovorus str. Tiberius]